MGRKKVRLLFELARPSGVAKEFEHPGSVQRPGTRQSRLWTTCQEQVGPGATLGCDSP
jgi:hypothetical protein